MADPKIKYDIEAGITGEADVEQLEASLRALGNTLDSDLKKQVDAAADALKNLGAKKDAVTNFQQLTNESNALSIELAQAGSALDKLAQQLPQAAAESSRFAAAEVAARTAAEGAAADLNEQRQALAALRQEYPAGTRSTDQYREANAQLLVSIREGRQFLKQKNDELKTSVSATAAAGVAEKKLATDYTTAAESAIRMRGAVQDNATALNAARTSLQGFGIQTTELAQSERNLEGAIGEVRQRVLGLAPAFAQAAAASNGAAQRQIADQRTVRDGVKSIGDELRKIQSIAAIAIGGSFLGGAIKDVADTADEFKNLQARIKLATGEGDAFKTSFQGVTDIALKTNSSLESTGTLFVRIAQAGQQAGLSASDAQQQSLALTETINQSVQLSGSSAEASNAAIVQLIQGLQSGVLRGDEFNSVMEQAPRLAQALAQGLGVTTGELRKLAEQGALTSATVIKSLTTQSAAVAAEFNQLPSTVGRSLQNLKTQWTLYVGAADNGMASSANVAKIIDGLAKNLDTLVAGLYAAGKAWAAIKIAGLAVDVYKWATATAGATAAVQSNTVAVEANTVAHAANAAAARASAAAGAGAATSAVAGAGKIAAAGSVLGRFSGLLGPVGIVLASLAPEIVGIGRSLGEGVAKWSGYGKAIQDAEDKMRLQEEATKSNAAQLRVMNIALQQARDRQFELSKEAAGAIAKFDQLRLNGDSAAEAIGKIGKDFDLASVPGIKNAGAVLDKLLAAAKITTAQFQASWAEALKGEDLAVFETRARAAFAGASREAERMAAVLDGTAREAIRRSGLEYDVLAGGIGKASRSAINDTDAIIESLDRLKSQGIDTGLALSASLTKGIDTADTQKALEAVEAQIEAMRAQLGNKVADGLLQQASAKADELKLKLENLKPGIQSTAEAFQFFGLQTEAALKRAATASQDAYDALKSSGQGSADQLRDAFVRTATEAIAANKGIAPSWVVVEAAIRGVQLRTDEYGHNTIESLQRAGEAWRAYAAEARDAQNSIGIIGPNQQIKSVTGDTREQRLAGQNAVDANLQFQLRDKLQQGTLGTDDVGALKTVIASLKQQNAVNGSASRLSAGFQSTEGVEDARAWQRTLAQFEQAVSRLQKPAPAERSTTHNVKLELPGGDGGAVTMGSEGDAKTLVDLLGRLKGRSS